MLPPADQAPRGAKPIHKRKWAIYLLLVACGIGLVFSRACLMGDVGAKPAAPRADLTAVQRDFLERLSKAALARQSEKVRYDPKYYQIAYPGGDIPKNRGVCSDEVIRSYRRLDIDLQQDVHEDILKHRSDYWQEAGLFNPDPNIDHRRVRNLGVFFKRQGVCLPISQRPMDYRPGEIVIWDLGGGSLHIGLLVNRQGWTGRILVLHNIGYGPVVEDVLFNWKIIGHYMYFGKSEIKLSPPVSRPYRRV